MIKYDNNTIYDWNFGDDNIIKVYRNNAICYYKVSGGSPTAQTPCYAVVDNISQYQDTEFEDVFNNADGKWYKRNNLNQYEEYGVYGSGRNITYYEGKLTIDEEVIPQPSRLPQGYTEVEYIERNASHNGYVGLGEYFQANTRIQIDFQMTQAKGNAIIGDYGSNDSDDWRVFLNYDSAVNNWLIYDFTNSRNYYNTGDWSKRFNIEIGNYYIKDLNTGNYLINETAKTVFSRPNQMYLFHIDGTQNTNNIDYGRIYSLKIWQNDVLVKEFVPCQRDSDDAVGLYDIVNNEFHNASGGTMVASSAVTPPSTKATCEFIYSGNSWVNVGEVSGSTATLPNVPFVLNYNAKNYDATTHSIPMTSGQLNDTDAIAENNPTSIVDHSADGYITISDSSFRIRKENQDISLFNRSSNSNSSDMTIVCKAKTTNGENIITNRAANYNWMYRLKGNGYLTLHGLGETDSLAWNTSNADIMSVRTYYDNDTKVKYDNWTQNTSSTPMSFTYGSTNVDSSAAGALFVGYGWNDNSEQWSGDFYWVYMAQANLTDAQIGDVIDYNEGGGSPIYPMYYDVMQDPPDNVTFSSMTEAESYECPWWGMSADIDNTDYMFCETNEWLTKYVYQEVSGEYMCYGGNKYKKMQEYDRNVDGTTSATTNYVIGDLIESGSTDCGSRLPSGYREVEYIENSAAVSNVQRQDFLALSFANTVTNDASGYTYTILFEPSDLTNTYGNLFGNSYMQNQMIGSGYNRLAVNFVNHDKNTADNSLAVGRKIQAKTYWIDGETYPNVDLTNITASTTTTTILTGSRTMTNNTTKVGLFNFYNTSDSGASTAKAKIYEVKVEDRQGNLLTHGIPCVRTSDNKCGFYNLARNEFEYDASGLLTLTAGPNVYPTPIDYTRR